MWSRTPSKTSEVRLPALSKEVYIAYKKSKGNVDTLNDLIKVHTPPATQAEKPPVTPSETPSKTPSDTPPVTPKTGEGSSEKPESSSKKASGKEGGGEGGHEQGKSEKNEGVDEGQTTENSAPKGGSDSIFKYREPLPAMDSQWLHSILYTGTPK
jgi:hypothetical protein